MTIPGDTIHGPAIPPRVNDLRQRPAPCKVPTPLRTLALCLGSLAVMSPWPLIGILLMHPTFDRSSEAFLLFGGITLFPLMLLALFGSPSEELLIALFMLVWLAAAVVPGLWLRRRLGSWWAAAVLLSVQTLFSAAQAVMGALLIIGKSV